MLPMMNQRLPHMPPHHGLGLLNSFMHHASPLDLMTAHHHDHPPTRTYNTQPSFVPSDPTENECKIVEYRGQKVAAFIIQGETMLCLPQAFDLFLKNLVGGLHTGYLSISLFTQNSVRDWRFCWADDERKIIRRTKLDAAVRKWCDNRSVNF